MRHFVVSVALELLAIELICGAAACLLAMGYLRRSSDRGETWGGLLRQLLAPLRAPLPHEDRAHFIVLAAAVLAAAFLRVLFITQPMRCDEAGTCTHYAAMPLYAGLSYYSGPNNHLFHTLLVHCSCAVFGIHPWAVRLPAFLAGVLLVPGTYLAARALYGKHAALPAAALVASSSFLVEYSTNARGYTLVALASVVLVALGARLQRSTSPRGWTLFAGLAALGLYTVPVMLYPFGAIMLWLLLSAIVGEAPLEGRARVTDVVYAGALAALLTAMLYGPVFAVCGPAVLTNSTVAPLAWAEFASRLPGSLVSTWRLSIRDMPPLIAALLASGFCISLVRHRRLATHRVPITLCLVAWIAGCLAGQRVVPFERVWLFLLPFYLMAASAGVVCRWWRRGEAGDRSAAAVSIGLALVLLVWPGVRLVQSRSVLHSTETGPMRDAEAITRYLRDRLRDGDQVVAHNPDDACLEYYFKLHRVPLQYLHHRFGSGNRLFQELFCRLQGIPVTYLDRDPATMKRLFVVVDDSPPRSARDLLRLENWSPNGWAERRTPVHFTMAQVHELTRQQPTNRRGLRPPRSP